MSKVGSDLFLVYDSSDDGFSEEQMEMLRFKNATQLSLFPESEKDVVYFASTSSFNNFTFRELVEDYVIRSILDMRQYPDFFGLFSSTKTALDYINSKDVSYIHSYGKWVDESASFDIVENLFGADFFFGDILKDVSANGDILVLVSSQLQKQEYLHLLQASLGAEDRWRAEAI